MHFFFLCPRIYLIVKHLQENDNEITEEKFSNWENVTEYEHRCNFIRSKRKTSTSDELFFLLLPLLNFNYLTSKISKHEISYHFNCSPSLRLTKDEIET